MSNRVIFSPFQSKKHEGDSFIQLITNRVLHIINMTHWILPGQSVLDAHLCSSDSQVIRSVLDLSLRM